MSLLYQDQVMSKLSNDVKKWLKNQCSALHLKIERSCSISPSSLTPILSIFGTLPRHTIYLGNTSLKVLWKPFVSIYFLFPSSIASYFFSQRIEVTLITLNLCIQLATANSLINVYGEDLQSGPRVFGWPFSFPSWLLMLIWLGWFISIAH